MHKKKEEKKKKKKKKKRKKKANQEKTGKQPIKQAIESQGENSERGEETHLPQEKRSDAVT